MQMVNAKSIRGSPLGIHSTVFRNVRPMAGGACVIAGDEIVCCESGCCNVRSNILLWNVAKASICISRQNLSMEPEYPGNTSNSPGESIRFAEV